MTNYLMRRGPDYFKKEYNGRAVIEPISFQATSGLDSSNTLQFTVPLESEFLEIGEMVSLGDTEFGGVITARDIDLKNKKVTYTGVTYFGILDNLAVMRIPAISQGDGTYYFRPNQSDIYALFHDAVEVNNSEIACIVRQDDAPDQSVYTQYFNGTIPYLNPGTYTGYLASINVSESDTILDLLKKTRDTVKLNPVLTLDFSQNLIQMRIGFRTPVTLTHYAEEGDDIVLSEAVGVNQLVAYDEIFDWYDVAYIRYDGEVMIHHWSLYQDEYARGHVKFMGNSIHRQWDSASGDDVGYIIWKKLIAQQRKTFASSIKLTSDDIDVATGDYIQIVAQSIGKRTEPQLVAEKSITIFNGKPTITYSLA